MHDINLAIRHANRVAVLDNGKIIAADSTEKILETDIIERTFSLARHATENAVFFS